MWLVASVEGRRTKGSTLLLTAAFLLLVTREARGSQKWYTEPRSMTSKLDDPIGPAPTCKGATYCEEVAEYPSERITQEIENNPQFLKYASVDMVSSVAQRTDEPDVEALCLSIEKVIYPKSAQGINGHWLYVVNNENFTQGVRIEVCVQENGSCRVIDGFAQGYTTSCNQKYIFRELSAITMDGKIAREYFRFPASCCCHVEFTGVARAMRNVYRPE